MANQRLCAAYACRERATTTVTVARLRRRENPHLDGWALDDPVTVHVCEHHRTAPEHALDLG